MAYGHTPFSPCRGNFVRASMPKPRGRSVIVSLYTMQCRRLETASNSDGLIAVSDGVDFPKKEDLYNAQNFPKYRHKLRLCKSTICSVKG